ncbi:hypothetical protein H257_08917 [Aphanomyces astaci]|uniref:Formiminotransferase N-terminal subdomain domain-containing protein n=1 Tax=Aphanomyces astaci TaxID=112090 RepID=W4GBF7_APHAT|nr:hypothetical protein H257_08917 [Aphanomyces astaci]ETV77000.1 hypothetical protein H257_08917 [Aphanomyces astaci]|eukprot:XP_009833306.1 hypothetical protein H257_08917 [Aphanomyces astaci]
MSSCSSSMTARGCAHLAIVYVSEGRCPSILSELAVFAATATATEAAPRALLAHSFADPTYNRTSFYFVGSHVAASASSFVKAALARLEFSTHRGTHPTLGTVDHVCFSPLGTATALDSASEASTFASSLHSAVPTLPIYGYGPRLTGLCLKDIRKSLGYFTPTTTGAATIGRLHALVKENPPSAWTTQHVNAKGIDPELLSPEPHGVLCMGSVPLVLNYNLRCHPQDSKLTVAKLTRQVRCIDQVEALTLQHQDGAYEVACNLLNCQEGTPAQVLSAAEAAAVEVGARITDAYFTGPTEAALLEAWRATIVLESGVKTS